jgi:hypothetical protein
MKTSLENDCCSITVDSFGGAIINFHLKNTAQINPLSFAFSKEQMPDNNKNGAPYQGHFLCLGRWGLPSEGEIKAGIPNHGEPANIHWEITSQTDYTLQMQTTAKLEGLHIEREIILDNNNPFFIVKESVQNINPLGRLYNMVQHPTLAEPFLDDGTIISCNATIGFDQSLYKNVKENILQWSKVKDDKENDFNLSAPAINYNAVFSFIVNQKDEYGWITAYSPKHNLLFGYVWKRKDYPWIHLWQHFENDKIKYRGIEFGTAGIHQLYKEILNTATELFGEKTFAYIDAGEIITKNYFSFIHSTDSYFTGVENIMIQDNTIFILPKDSSTVINFKLSTELFHEL